MSSFLRPPPDRPCTATACWSKSPSFRPDGRAEGRIVRSVARAHPTVVGIFHYDRRHNYVKPIDEKVTQEIIIPPGMEIPQPLVHRDPSRGRQRRPCVRCARGQGLAQASVRDTEKNPSTASSATRPPATPNWQDLEGVVVDVEITDWPSATQNPRGRVVEILGEENDFGVDVEIMIRKFHLPHRFPPEVIEEAQADRE